MLLTSKKMRVWQIFCTSQAELEKKNRIHVKNFTEKMKEIGLDDNRIQLIISYIARSEYVYLQDFIYYMKVAWSVIAVDLGASNFSQIFMKNSTMLQSRLEKFKLDSGIVIHEESLEEKLNRLDAERCILNKEKEKKMRDESSSRKSSDKHERKMKEVSEIDELSVEKSKSKSI